MAAKMAASLAYLMLAQTESVGVGLFADRLERWQAPRSGSHQLSRVIDLLELYNVTDTWRAWHLHAPARDAISGEEFDAGELWLAPYRPVWLLPR